MNTAAPRDLATLQRRFFGLIRRPLDADFRLTPLPADGECSAAALHALVTPNARLTAEERLEIYARQYWFRLLDSFTEDFPGVAAILGPDHFRALAIAYLDAHPSRDYALRRLGANFPAFLAGRVGPAPADPARAAAVDMARLEWAKLEIFDAAERPPLQPDAALDQGLLRVRIALQPHVRLLTLAYPVDAWLVRVQREEWRAEASNAVAADTPAGAAHAGHPATFRRRRVHVVVHRHAERPYLKRVPAEAMGLLRGFADGGTLGDALDAVLAGSRMPLAWWQQRLHAWFADWRALNWLCDGRGAGR